MSALIFTRTAVCFNIQIPETQSNTPSLHTICYQNSIWTILIHIVLLWSLSVCLTSITQCVNVHFYTCGDVWRSVRCYVMLWCCDKETNSTLWHMRRSGWLIFLPSDRAEWSAGFVVYQNWFDPQSWYCFLLEKLSKTTEEDFLTSNINSDVLHLHLNIQSQCHQNALPVRHMTQQPTSLIRV